MFDSGPWYESQGPDISYVRKDITDCCISYVKKKNLFKYMNTKEKEMSINECVIEVIPDGESGFGSFRGYCCFCQPEYKNKAFDLLNKKNALLVLKYKFSPYINHWLYHPGGIRYNKLLNTTTYKTK